MSNFMFLILAPVIKILLLFFHSMGPKRKKPAAATPTQKRANTIKKKYGKRMTPDSISSSF
jgi:hypothetical protein